MAKGNPNWPQAFYPMDKTMTVNPGEILVARCTYNTTGHHTPTRIGATGGDEMCNLYLMFYTLSAKDNFIVCADEQNTALSSLLPPGNDVPLPPNPALQHQAVGMEAGLVSYDNGLPEGETVPSPAKKGESSVKKRPGVDTGSVKKKPGVEPDYGDYTFNTTVDTATNTFNTGDGTEFNDNVDGSDETAGGMQPRAATYSEYQEGFVYTISLREIWEGILYELLSCQFQQAFFMNLMNF